ncbi:glycosyltransferase family 25 protein [Falsigemmobacter faecalis]|uniref:glycosyltransferase family 25 protein n=1 Tax=Falsigemmobacter faecalis TaxID=2488730 RepID=UPI0013150AB1|nr:glycosyltransferase family 25 protein [Falsigemmobacter faecalis]
MINLDRSTDRLDALKVQFSRAGRNFRRFAAIAPDVIDTHPEFDNHRFRSLHNRPIRRGELGCALSHKRCLEIFLASDEEHCLVFEDDVCFDDQTFPAIEATLAWLEAHPGQRWHCINLSSPYPKRYRNIADIAGRRLRRSFQFPILMSAILWNREGAAEFLRDLNEQKLHRPVDDQLRYLMSRSGLGLSFDMPPVGLTYVTSVIGPEGAADRGTRNGWYDLKRRLPLYGWALWNTVRS